MHSAPNEFFLKYVRIIAISRGVIKRVVPSLKVEEEALDCGGCFE